MITNRSIICFGGEDWWYHHPHSKNHLMRRFARAGNKVIFVNSISMGLAPMKSGDLLPRVKRKLKSYAKLARTTEEGITVVSPAVVPFFGSAGPRATNRRLLTAQISSLAKRRGLTQPILWIAIPTAIEVDRSAERIADDLSRFRQVRCEHDGPRDRSGADSQAARARHRSRGSDFLLQPETAGRSDDGTREVSSARTSR